MLTLRDYQFATEQAIQACWMTLKFILAVLPTGAGKTVLFAKILYDHVGPAVAIAHRQELVLQISVALAKFGLKHNIIAPKNVIYQIIEEHIEKTGQSFYSPSSTVAVAGIDTLLRRADTMKNWMKSVTLWVTDEAHHLLVENKWGKGCALFPNAKGLGVTATPVRADGAGLGHHSDGVFQTMIEGATMRNLINRGYLTDYKVFAPESDLDLEGVKISDKTGEMSPKQLKARALKSHIVGDVVEQYIKRAYGKLGVTFAIDVEEATKIANKFKVSGIPAAVVHAKTSTGERNRLLKKFKRREILQLVNVDLFGEGFDLPAIEVVSFARPTASYALFVQQFGRVLRLLIDENLKSKWDSFTDQERLNHIAQSEKPFGIIIDHVGNVFRHNLPDKIQKWSLDAREKVTRRQRDPDEIPLKRCPHCAGAYEAIYKICPYCGEEDVPVDRSSPEKVDGDLFELSPEVLAKLRGEIAKVDGPAFAPMGSTKIVANSISKNHRLRKEAQESLRNLIRWHGGYHESIGIDQSESWKRFYFRFGVDVLTAQTLGIKDANKLENDIRNYLQTVKQVIT